MAPEALEGSYNLETTDVYSYGVVMLATFMKTDAVKWCAVRGLALHNSKSAVMTTWILDSWKLESQESWTGDQTAVDRLARLVETTWREPIKRPTFDTVLGKLEQASQACVRVSMLYTLGTSSELKIDAALLPSEQTSTMDGVSIWSASM
eukprot:3225965-Amphidinium_carterae.1